jgi:hypothetical protein
MNVYFFVGALVMLLGALSVMVRPLPAGPRARSQGNARLQLLVAIIAIVFSTGLYSVLGKPNFAWSTSHACGLSTNDIRSQRVAAKTDGIGSVSSLLTGLEERLNDSPEDAKGWLLLAKTYQHLGQDDDAKSAYEKAAALGQTDTTFAESLAVAPAPAKHGAEIRGRVSLSEAAMSMVEESDTVFIFAKAFNGPAMPLAVIRRPVTDLPFEFVLSDQQSMVKGSGLSSVDQVIVTAKITASRDALNNDPTLVAHSDPVATTDSPYLGLRIGPAATDNKQ